MGNCGILQGNVYDILTWKRNLACPQEIVFQHTVITEFLQNAFPVHTVQIFRCILPGKLEFFHQFDFQFFLRKILTFDLPFYRKDLIFRDQTMPLYINAQHLPALDTSDTYNAHI